MVTPSCFHVHAKPSFTTFTMNNTFAEEIKGEGGGSSPNRGSGNGGMPGKIWWAGLSCSHKQYLGSTYWQERGCSKFPTSEAGLLLLTMRSIIFCIWLGCVLSLRLSNYPSSQPTSYWNVWVLKATAEHLEKGLLCSSKYPVEITSSTQTMRLEWFLRGCWKEPLSNDGKPSLSSHEGI